MILHSLSLRWLSLYFLFGQYVRADWPSLNSSNIQLLGLFPDVLNASKPMALSVHSRAMFISAILLSHQYNITIGGQFIGWKSIQTRGDVMGAIRSSCLMISSSNIVGIVGPGYSSEALVLALFAKTIGIPMISYGATDPELSDRNAYPAFYRTVPSDNTAALAIVQLFIKFNWTSCIILYQNDAFGFGGAKIISEAFNNNNLVVADTIIFDIGTLSIRGDLKNRLISSSIRTVILWAVPDYTTLILQNALDNDVLGPRFTWILSSEISLNDFNQIWYEKLSGILTIEPVVGSAVNSPINKTLLNAAYNIWQQYEPETFPGSDNVNSYALFAFDATWASIQSLQQFCSIIPENSSSCISFINTSFCFDRLLLNSDSFYNIINDTKFLGVSGSIQFNINVTDRISRTYYIAKNIQYSSNNLNYIPVLVWSNSDSWRSYTPSNVIIWPGNSLVSPSGFASVAGVNLRIAVIETAPFTIVTQVVDDSGQIATKLIGYVPDLIEILQDKMGFIPNIKLVINQTFNNIIDAVANDVYDIFIAQTTITARRMEEVAFSNSIYDNSLRIIIRKESKTNINFLSFSFQLWIILLIVSVYAGFLIYLLEQQDNAELRDKSMISLVIYSIETIIGYGVNFYVARATGRLLRLGLYILSLVLVAVYAANLASDLTILKLQTIISGIDDIKNGKLSFSRIGILVGSSFEDYYLREISGGKRNFYPLKTKQEIYDSLLNNRIDASIMDAAVLEYIISNVYCNLTLIGADFDKSAFGIVFQKKSLYQQEFDVNILSLRESGVFDDLRKKWFQANLCSQSSTSMSIESMDGLFLTFAIISILVVLLYLWKKRFIIKDSLLTFARRKNLLAESDVSSVTNSIENSSEPSSIW